MKTFKYKITSLLILLCIGLQAQNFDKKVKETFKVNSEVSIDINSSHTDIDIETWNKNEVSIEGFMEVSGVSKEEAEKILTKWKFQALGNKSMVEVTSFSDNMDFNFNVDFLDEDIDVADFYFEMPALPEMPKLPKMAKLPKMPKLPEMPELPKIEFDYETYKNDSTYLKRYKKEIAAEVAKFKSSEWKIKIDSVRNSEEFKRSMEEMKNASKEIAIEMNKIKNSEAYKKTIKEAHKAADIARKEMLENKEVWKEQAMRAKEVSIIAMEMIQQMKENGTFDSIQKLSENIYFDYSDSKKSKIKIKRYIKIKVPKNATFNINVRHGKLNIPSSSKKISAHISYGNFIAGIISGDKNKLNFTNTPVVINTIQSGTITLKNVPKASFGTFSNTNLFANSSEVIIDEIGDNAALSQKFGTLEIKNISPNFENLNLIIDYSRATLNLSQASYLFKINNKKTKFSLANSLTETSKKNTNDITILDGFHKDKSSANTLIITGIYSAVVIN